MKINLKIDTNENTIELLYNGYNIIATTIHDELMTNLLYETLLSGVNVYRFEEIKTEQEFEKFLNLKESKND